MLKIVSLALLVAMECPFALTQTQSASASKTIKGSGCIENGVENSCHVLIDSKTGDTYNLLFSSKVPKTGTPILFKGAEHQGTTTCMQGKAVNVTKWKKEKGIKCPPPVHSVGAGPLVANEE
jgi:hypothetical protein